MNPVGGSRISLEPMPWVLRQSAAPRRAWQKRGRGGYPSSTDWRLVINRAGVGLDRQHRGFGGGWTPGVGGGDVLQIEIYRPRAALTLGSKGGLAAPRAHRLGHHLIAGACPKRHGGASGRTCTCHVLAFLKDICSGTETLPSIQTALDWARRGGPHDRTMRLGRSFQPLTRTAWIRRVL